MEETGSFLTIKEGQRMEEELGELKSKLKRKKPEEDIFNDIMNDIYPRQMNKSKEKTHEEEASKIKELEEKLEHISEDNRRRSKEKERIERENLT